MPFLFPNYAQALPTFSPRPHNLPLGSNTKENPAETAKKIKNQITKTHTSFIIA